MSSPLDKNHPFRATITHTPHTQFQAASDNTARAPAAAQAMPEEDAGSPLTFRLKVVAGCSALAVIFYVCSSAVDMLAASGADEEEEEGGRRSRVESYSQDVEDDWAYQGDNRSVEAARSEAGIFGRLFCRGGRRSTFCQ